MDTIPPAVEVAATLELLRDRRRVVGRGNILGVLLGRAR